MEDLVNVDGIGAKTVEKIKNDVLLSDVAAVADQKTEKKIDEKTDKKIAEKTK